MKKEFVIGLVGIIALVALFLGINFLKGKAVEVTTEQGVNGAVTVNAVCDGLIQRFVFTPI